MGKSSPSPPAAPDPSATAAAQTKSNQQTALYNFGLNNPNYNTPLGSLSYTQTSGQPTYDNEAYQKALSAWQASGGSSNAQPTPSDPLVHNPNAIGRDLSQGSDTASSPGMPKLSDFMINDGTNPQFTANVKLSPEQQQLYDLSTSQSIDLSKLASMLQGNVSNTLQQPTPGDADFNKQSQDATDAYYANQKRLLDPQWQQQQTQLDSQLANQGLTLGSEAYTNAENNFARQKQSAYDTAQNNAILAGPQNAQQLFSLSSAARELPLNEFNALRSQSQVQMPQFQGTNTAQAQPTNTAQIAQNAYLGNQNAYNQQVASQNAMTSGLFSLGGTLGAAYLLSDIRLKENIKYVGSEKGFPIYYFSYRNDPEKIKYRGVMAQEVLLTHPDAVISDGSYLAVDYHKIGIEFGRVH